jgi:nitroimidazol reductase NimA-like FMN-containing flavoprotein (pyridoxamine 5'-phosphate oxidase superfamily)
VKRGADRADYDPAAVRAILEAAFVAHVGVATDQGPIVIPMIYGVRDDEILIHGSAANAMMRAGRSHDVCVTVTLVDGLVVARTPFHNSVNYRSVVIRGEATRIDDADAKREALEVINDHIVPMWANSRPPSEQDVKKTMVLAVPLTEASAKIRRGDPIDEPGDVAGPYWAGVVPLHTSWGEPHASADLTPGIEMPAPIAALGGSDAHPA